MDLGLNIYNLVVDILGTLPVELNFIYSVCTILVFCFILIFTFAPFAIVYHLMSER